MYLNHFCFVLVLVAVSANYIHEELPLYLSDDILISKIPSISKRSVPDATQPEKPIPTNPKESKHGRNVDQEIENEEESGLVFIPSFGRRTRRSTPDLNHESSQKTQDGNVEDKSANNHEQNSKKKNVNTETEKEAESGLVFLPSFGRRTRRSTEIDNQKSNEQDKAEASTTDGQNSQKKNQNQNSETEKEAESGLVFLPSFGRRTRRSTETDHEKKDNKQGTNDRIKPVSNHEQNIKNKKQNSEVEKEAESGLVFLPSFGRRTRRSAILKEEDLFNSESNIVFLPSFRRNGFRRFRREVDDSYNKHLIKRSADKKTDDNERKTKSLTTERNEELSDSDTVNGQESGLVFLPSFGRRSRRSLEETSTPLLNHQDVSTTTIRTEKDNQNVYENASTPLRIKRDITTEKPNKKKNTENSEDDESEEESGLVFIPSFGRRQRRDTSSTDISVKSGNSQSLPKKKEDTVPKKTLSSQESGLVFLPTFNRRTRRDLSTEKPKSVEDSTKQQDVEEQESGLVFLPSFGRRTRRFV